MNISTQDTTRQGIALLRISLGVMTLSHGLLKLFVFTPAGTVGYFESLGLPAVMAYGTMVFELIGGVLLIVGLFTRFFSAAMIPVLLGSIVFAHWNAGWVFSNQGGGWEFPAFWAAASVAQALLGSGAYSLDSARVVQKLPAFLRA